MNTKITENLGVAYLMKLAGEVSEEQLESYTRKMLKHADYYDGDNSGGAGRYVGHAIIGGGVGAAGGALLTSSKAMEDVLDHVNSKGTYKVSVGKDAKGVEQFADKIKLEHIPELIEKHPELKKMYGEKFWEHAPARMGGGAAVGAAAMLLANHIFNSPRQRPSYVYPPQV